jgi:hypothetical protein
MQEFVMLRDTLGSLADQVAEVRRVLEDVLDSLRKVSHLLAGRVLMEAEYGDNADPYRS